MHWSTPAIEVTGLATNALPPIAARSLGAGGRRTPDDRTGRHPRRDGRAIRVRPRSAGGRDSRCGHHRRPDRERTDARVIVDVNVGGTQSILDACDASGVPRLVYVSSGAVYGDLTFVDAEELVETTCVAPTGLYGITKLAGEQLVRRHGELHPLETITTRLSAVFGPWEYQTGVRDFMSPMLQLAAAARRGEAQSVRARRRAQLGDCPGRRSRSGRTGTGSTTGVRLLQRLPCRPVWYRTMDRPASNGLPRR